MKGRHSLDDGWDIMSALRRLFFRAKKLEYQGPQRAVWSVVTALRSHDGRIADKVAFDDIVRIREVCESLGKIWGEVATPDFALKLTTTARVRGILGLRYEGNYITKTQLTKEQVEIRDMLLDKADTHFTTHFCGAMIALKKCGYDVPLLERIDES